MVILNLDPYTFLVTRAWCTDSVVCSFMYSYHRYSLSRLLCTKHYAGQLDVAGSKISSLSSGIHSLLV